MTDKHERDLKWIIHYLVTLRRKTADDIAKTVSDYGRYDFDDLDALCQTQKFIDSLEAAVQHEKYERFESEYHDLPPVKAAESVFVGMTTLAPDAHPLWACLQMIDKYVMSDQIVKDDPETFRLARKAHDAMFAICRKIEAKKSQPSE